MTVRIASADQGNSEQAHFEFSGIGGCRRWSEGDRRRQMSRLRRRPHLAELYRGRASGSHGCPVKNSSAARV